MQNKLFIAVMYPDKANLNNIKKKLTDNFGSILFENLPYKFSYTKYYEAEFGSNLLKIFLIFDKDIIKDDLIQIRNITGYLESLFMQQGKRTVNIDPGYISSYELVLASKKHRNFKENLGENIYAHKILEIFSTKVNTFYHTFPDYKDVNNLEFLKMVMSNLN